MTQGSSEAHCAAMSHEFIPGERTDTGYDECDGCGLLVAPEVTSWITLYCIFKPCRGAGNHGSPCVMVEDAGKAICSYCERVGGDEESADDYVDWLDESEWPAVDDEEWDDVPAYAV